MAKVTGKNVHPNKNPLSVGGQIIYYGESAEVDESALSKVLVKVNPNAADKKAAKAEAAAKAKADAAAKAKADADAEEAAKNLADEEAKKGSDK